MKEHILLHVCCGPCAIVPVLRLRAKGHKVTAFFANPNIHPLQEYLRRRESLIDCAKKIDFTVLFADDLWNIHTWLADVAGAKDTGAERCGYCYETRLEATAQRVKKSPEVMANEPPFTAFSSSLFYSRYQDHAQMKTIAENMAEKYAVKFYYEDFRDEWQKGIDMSKELELYRQPYCGCIYSEAERYAKKLAQCKK